MAAQREALTAAGCERVYEDVVSGASVERAGLWAALAWAREGDCLVVARLDRLARTTLDTLRTVAMLEDRGIGLRAMDLDLDTSTLAGRLVLRTLVSLAEWERELLVERTRSGLAHARSQGRVGGRPRTFSQEAVAAVRAAIEAGLSVNEVAALHGVSRRTIARVRDGAY